MSADKTSRFVVLEQNVMFASELNGASIQCRSPSARPKARSQKCGDD